MSFLLPLGSPGLHSWVSGNAKAECGGIAETRKRQEVAWKIWREKGMKKIWRAKWIRIRRNKHGFFFIF
jgi:hypothetical protein